MKTNQKQLKLIQYGLRPSTVTNLSESQVNSLYKRLNESKEDYCDACDRVKSECVCDKKTETKEQKGTVSVKGADVNKIKTLTDQGINVQVTETEMYEDDGSELDYNVGDTQDPIQKGPTGDGDPNSIQEKEIMEKFESKKQQKYFFAKCGDGKLKNKRNGVKWQKNSLTKPISKSYLKRKNKKLKKVV